MRRIVANEVTEVICFEPGERPVFCLTFSSGQKLVVKAEIKTQSGHASQSIPLAGAMMRQVSKTLEVELLDDNEFVALRTLTQSPNLFRPPQQAVATREYLELYTAPENKIFNVFVKMPFFSNISDMSKIRPRIMLVMLKKRPALFSFGKIVAVDQFNGNNDRFNAMGELVNEGNLIFERNNNGEITPVGLDFFQAQGEAANLVERPPEPQVLRKGFVKILWGGHNLENELNIRYFSERVIQSLNEYFRGKNPNITLLGEDDELEFVNGMKAGIRDLKTFLSMRGGLPEGVKVRMDRLKWPYNNAVPSRPQARTPY